MLISQINSESIVGNLLLELDSISSRMKNISLIFKQTINKDLKDRLILEHKELETRSKEISSIAKNLTVQSPEKLTLLNLLNELCNRIKRDLFYSQSLFII